PNIIRFKILLERRFLLKKKKKEKRKGKPYARNFSPEHKNCKFYNSSDNSTLTTMTNSSVLKDHDHWQPYRLQNKVAQPVITNSHFVISSDVHNNYFQPKFVFPLMDFLLA
ncbi:hypothetical protein PanWU01x14_002350, partial [Parasponia andersonii]